MLGAYVRQHALLARAGVARKLPASTLAVGAAVAVIGVAIGLIWSVISTLRGITASNGPAEILTPAAGYSGRIGWSYPGAYMPVAIAAVVAALAVAAALVLRSRPRTAALVALAGAAIATAVAIPLSPLHDLLVRDTAAPRSGLAGPFLPWMIAAFFGWATVLLFLALISDRHSWAFFFYVLMWTFWIPPAVMNNLPSLGVERPAIASSSPVEELMNSRMAERLRSAGSLALENGSLVALTNTGALSLTSGMSALQASQPPRIPVFQVQGAGRTSYLRTGTGDVYEGGKWRSFPKLPVDVPAGADFGSAVAQALSGGVSTSPGLGGLPAGVQPGLLTPSTGAAHAFQESLKVTPPPGATSLGPGTVPVSSFPRAAAVDGTYDALSGTLAATKSVPGVGWQAETPAYTEDELQVAEFADAPAYLQLPPELPQRVKDLAADITRLERTPYAKARAIERYLKSNYRYGFADEPAVQGGSGNGTGSGGASSGGSGTRSSAGPGVSGDLAHGADPVDDFLFERHTGTCGNFSSAFVVLARSVGIPSRVVSGWSISPTAETQAVKADQAHQWAEVAFSPLGWVTFEPTPADGAPGRTADSGGVAPVTRQPGAGAPARVSEVPEITPAPAAAQVARPTPTASSSGASSQAPTGKPLPITPPAESGGAGEATGGGISPAGGQPGGPASPPSGQGGQESTSSADESSGDGAPDANLVETRTEIQSIEPSRLRAGDTGRVIGTVTAVDGEMVAGPGIEVFISREKAKGGLLIGTGAVEAGRFDVEVSLPADLPVGKYQVIAHAVADSRFGESWSDPEVEVFAGTLIRWRGPVDMVVGQPATFTGTLTTDGGVPIPGAAVTVIAEGRTYGLTTGGDGGFATALTLQTAGRQDITARYGGSDLNLPQDATLAVTARYPVVLDVRWPASVTRGGDLQVTGSLKTRGGKPEPGRTIEFSIAGVPSIATASTDGSGAFSWTLRFDDVGRRRITVSHPRSETLEPASVAGEFVVEEAPAPSFNTALIAAVAAVALIAGTGAGWAAAVIVGRRSRRTANVPTGMASGGSEDGLKVHDMTGATTSAHADGRTAPQHPQVSLRLELPQIEQDLPAVWGLGDPLLIRGMAASASGEGIAGVALRFGAGLDASLVSATDSSGTASLTRTFAKPGTLELTCRTDEPGDPSAAPPAQLRVVDYRQEVVRLFNDFLNRHRNGARLGPGVTPRDAEMMLVSKALIVDQAALDVLISAFEEADYSEHQISRVHYVRAYRAWRSLTHAKEAEPVAAAPAT